MLDRRGSIDAFRRHRAGHNLARPLASCGGKFGPVLPPKPLRTCSHTVAVHMIRRCGKARAVAADNRLQSLVEIAVADIGGGGTFSRLRDSIAQSRQIDGQH